MSESTLSPLQRAALVVRDLRERVQALEAARQEPIAVIGLGCRFPGAADPDAYWHLLQDGVDATGEVPADRWDAAPLMEQGRLTTARGGFLSGAPAGFDAGFFGIAPREAVSIDPQQRLLLEVAWEALEDAGAAGARLADGSTGVFVGISMIDYARRLMDRPPEQIDAYTASGSLHSVASGRLSFSFNLTGPSLSVDTACSSSLVAVHLACRALRSGECDMALAGGVNLLLAPELSVTFSASGMLSPDGRCKTFDACADGYGRAEGCGVVVLKRLSRAVAVGDRILAVIRGSAVNQDGATSGLTVPNGPAQAAVIRAALRDGGVDASAVGLIEAHGTGTSLGDPIEMGALRDVFAAGRDAADPLWVGSVKTNIGHAEGAAGIAGLIKLVLALQRRSIPAHLHLREPNPLIDWAGGALAVPRTGQAFAARGGRWIAGVSSFGFSGTNAHVVLEAAPEAAEAADEGGPGLYVVSAKSEAALSAAVERHAAFLEGSDAPWGSLCHTAGAGRSHFSHRAAVVAADAGDAARRLRGPGCGRGRVATGSRPKLAFLFTGQGSVWPGMGLAPGLRRGVFASVIEEAETLLADGLRRPLREVLAGADDLLSRTDHAQVALYVLQSALVATWRSWGVEPALVLGHSVGEYAAAHAAGVFDFATGLRLVLARGRLMQALPAGGGMVSVALDPAAAAALAGQERLVTVGAQNGPQANVLSGPVAALERLLGRLPSEVGRQWLEVSHGFHSPLMQPAGAGLAAAFAGLALSAPRVGFVSTVSGRLAGAEVAQAGYWVEQVEAPVRFASGMAALSAAGATGFVEIGPQPVLLGLGRRCVAEPDRHVWTASLRAQDDTGRQLPEALGALYLHGVTPNWNQPNTKIPKTNIPTYPWQRALMWIPPAKGGARPAAGDPLTPRRIDSPLRQALFETRLSAESPSFLGAHRVGGEVVAPLTVMVELVLRSAQTLGHPALQALQVETRLTLPREEPRDVQLLFEEAAGGVRRVALYSRAGDGEWVQHASGVAGPALPPAGGEPLDAARQCCPETLDMAEFRASVARSGIVLEPPFDGLQHIRRGADSAVGQVVSAPGTPGCVVLDACLQAAFALLPPDAGTWLPVRLEGVWLDRPMPSTVWVTARALQQDEAALRVSLQMFDSDGIRFGHVAALELRPEALQDDVAGLLYRSEWVERPWQTHSAAPDGLGLLSFADTALQRALGSAEGEAYAAALTDIEELAAVYARQALVVLGWNGLPPGGPDTWADRLGVMPARRALFHRLLRVAGLDGSAHRPLAPTDPQVQHDGWSSRHAVATIEHVLLNRCGAALPDVLRGRADSLPLLFPGGDSTDALALYAGSPWARTMSETLAGAVRDIVARRGAAGLRVLEIGGGTGATTALLLPLLPPGSEYVFTDISLRFTRAAQGRFAGIIARTLDIEREPAGQGFATGSFDLVIAANVLHATADLAVSLRHAASLLAPGGVLGLIEGTGPLAWGDLTFGLTEGWWRFTDTALRPDYPMIPLESWRSLLRSSGFVEVVAFDPADHPNGRQFRQAVIVARRGEQATGAWWVLGDAAAAAPLCKALAMEGAGICQSPPSAGMLLAGVAVAALPGETSSGHPGPWLKLALEGVQDRLRTGDAVPLWLVTAGAAPTGAGGTLAGLAGSALHGLVRTVRRERPDLVCTLLDLPALPDAVDLAQAARVMLSGAGGEDDLAIRAGRLHVARLRRAGAPSLAVQGAPFRLALAEPGLIGSIHAVAMKQPTPGPGEIVVETHAIGLNFRDVLAALDLYPGETGGLLGQECAGRVVAAGPGARFAAGDTVMAIGAGAMASHLRIPADLAVAIPAGLGMAQAAAQPVAFVTALHALIGVARLRPNETVLVHSAASGTGLACLRVAKALGARVFATASTGKHNVPAAEGAEAVFDSRGTDFGDAVLAATGGRGVDLVVNALSGPGFIEASLAAVAQGGRFVELGRRGILDAGEVYGRRPDIRYACLDLARSSREDPALIAQTLREVADWLGEGKIAPLPVQLYPVEEAPAALRLMEHGRQTGKLVLTRAPGPARFRGTWMVTGGLGGLGLAVAAWLGERGVARVILVGRGEPGAAGAAAVARLRGLGVAVEVRIADVRDRAALCGVVEEAGPALRGVVHAAGVLDDGTLDQLDWGRFDAVLGPKVSGAWHLHELTLGRELDGFVLFSSAASLLGNAGQGNHAAANAYLDGLAQHRHALGLPALSVNWGAWADIGAAADALGALAQRGLRAMPVRLALDALGRALDRNEPVLGAVAVDWPIFLAHGGVTPRFFETFGGEEMSSPTQATPAWRELPAAERPDAVLAEVTAVVAAVLGLAPAALEPDARFFEVGMDSLTAIEARHRLEKAFALKLNATVALDYPTPLAVARHVLALLQPAAVAFDEPDDELTNLGEDEVAARLSQRLDALGDMNA